MHVKKLIPATEFLASWAYNKGFKPCRVPQFAMVLGAPSKNITVTNSFIKERLTSPLASVADSCHCYMNIQARHKGLP